MMVSYRMDGASGSIYLSTVGDLSLAFNKVASHQLKLDMDKLCKFVRVEGKVKIGKKNYPAIMQGGLIVVEGGPEIPDRIEIKF